MILKKFVGLCQTRSTWHTARLVFVLRRGCLGESHVEVRRMYLFLRSACRPSLQLVARSLVYHVTHYPVRGSGGDILTTPSWSPTSRSSMRTGTPM